MSKERCGCVLGPEGLPPELEELARLRHEEIVLLRDFRCAGEANNGQRQTALGHALDGVRQKIGAIMHSWAMETTIAS